MDYLNFTVPLSYQRKTELMNVKQQQITEKRSHQLLKPDDSKKESPTLEPDNLKAIFVLGKYRYSILKISLGGEYI